LAFSCFSPEVKADGGHALLYKNTAASSVSTGLVCRRSEHCQQSCNVNLRPGVQTCHYGFSPERYIAAATRIGNAWTTVTKPNNLIKKSQLMTEICTLIPLVPLAQGLHSPAPPFHGIWTLYWHFSSNSFIGWAFKIFWLHLYFLTNRRSQNFSCPCMVMYTQQTQQFSKVYNPINIGLQWFDFVL